MNRAKKWILPILVIVLASLSFYLIIQNHRLKRRPTFPQTGDRIDTFSLIDTDGRPYESGNDLEKGLLVFVFQRPCAPCNMNMTIWNRIASIAGKWCRVAGVVLSDLTEAVNLNEKAAMRYPVYIPRNRDRFIETFHLYQPFSYTIAVKRGKIIYSKIGDLNGDDYLQLLNIIKES